VLHIDSSADYGGRDASLSLKDLVAFVQRPPAQLHISKLSNPVPISEHLLNRSRDYAISLSPTVLPATGPLITALVQSGVARYGAFKLLDAIGVYRTDGGVETIPASKEDVFKSKALSLIEKRKLMKFLMFASGDFDTSDTLRGKEDIAFSEFLKGPDFGLSTELASAVAYALAHCPEESGECVITRYLYFCFRADYFSEPALPALLRLRRYIRSSGRYGNSPFLVGHYGGAGSCLKVFAGECTSDSVWARNHGFSEL
jgi:RAB protein geranylgeranyltransferase component A